MLTTKNVIAGLIFVFVIASSLSSAHAVPLEGNHIRPTNLDGYRVGKVDPYTDSWAVSDAAI
nr:hypothetical protein [uncultured Cupriavidus sp.]